MIDADILRKLVQTEVSNFAALARVAGGDPKTFYRGANFNNADLRGEDLRGFDLTAATFKQTRVDRMTKVDNEFVTMLGLERKTTVEIADTVIIYSDLGVRKPSPYLLGDIIEETLFGQDKDHYLNEMTDMGKLITRVKEVLNRPSAKDIDETPSDEDHEVIDFLSMDTPTFLAAEFRSVSLTERTHRAVVKISRRISLDIPQLCSDLLRAYAGKQKNKRNKKTYLQR